MSSVFASFSLLVLAVPVILVILPLFLPAHWSEPYSWWDPLILNRPLAGGEATTRWTNMGYWEGTEEFADANEQLARKLLDFSRARKGGNVLDLAHGAGESLALHLSQSPPPAYLGALTSNPSDTSLAQKMISERNLNTSTPIEWFTTSASFKPTSDIHHPLNPMRGYLGEPQTHLTRYEDEDETQQSSQDDVGPRKYDLIYILDAIYHFPPSLEGFIKSILPTLKSGGVVADTDILPPQNLNIVTRLSVARLFGVPVDNLRRDWDLETYKRVLQEIGYVGVEVEDWSDHVWSGISENLRKRRGVLGLLSRGFRSAERSGWKFVAVRAEAPEISGDAGEST
ncbi:hypothetical protein M231_03900 [Tremella mesenterica]|uniref:S-adenosyl-L-methionine-dependent methyltransferase n=1 Tax=Tremella mesenterica TaxID=5217 RepID=A0A4Q1BM14_TREME|nr:hypothetical protein M231_03900 [Tremella mesenterica]